MDALTHGLAGAVIAGAAFEPSLGKWGVITGVTVALLPDIDFLLKFINKKLYIKYHRSFANSIFLLIPFSFFWGYFFYWISGLQLYFHFVSLTFLVLLSHIFFDALNPFGTMIFVPFSNYRFSWDVVYVVDLVFSNLLLFPLIASYIWSAYRQRICLISLASLALYIFFRFIHHAQANRHNKQFIEANQLEAENFASLPSHRSPFRWNNLIETEDSIYKGGINFLERGGGNGNSKYRSWPKFNYQDSNENSEWIQKALELPEVKTYLWFARFPVTKYHGLVHDTHRVAFYDFRFEGYKGKLPFVYIVDFYPNGQLRGQRFHSNWDLKILTKSRKSIFSP